MAFRMVLQYGPGNLIVVDEEGDEVEVIEDSEGEVEVLREMTPAEQAGRLVPIEEVPRDQDIWEDERNFCQDRATEDRDLVPNYPKPLKYIPPPVYN